MGRSVELDEEVYDRIEALARADEGVSETIARLIEGPSLLDLVGAFGGDDLDAMREAREAATVAEREEIDDFRERLGERFDERFEQPSDADVESGAEGDPK